MPLNPPLPADRVRALTAHCRPLYVPPPPKKPRTLLTPGEIRHKNNERYKKWHRNNPAKVKAKAAARARARKALRESR